MSKIPTNWFVTKFNLALHTQKETCCFKCSRKKNQFGPPNPCFVACPWKNCALSRGNRTSQGTERWPSTAEKLLRLTLLTLRKDTPLGRFHRWSQREQLRSPRVDTARNVKKSMLSSWRFKIREKTHRARWCLFLRSRNSALKTSVESMLSWRIRWFKAQHSAPGPKAEQDPKSPIPEVHKAIHHHLEMSEMLP